MVESTLEAHPGDRVEPIPAFAPGTTIAHFKIVRELGAGGMGIVYEAHDPDLDRRVAVKVVRDRRVGTAAGMRLIAEAQAMARLAHPNVVGVHEVGTIDNQVFVVMELVRGDTLAGWLDRHPRPWRDVVEVFLQAGQGLLAAHHAGLIHRDFKPSNVLIDHAGRVRVGDFGLARSERGPFAEGTGPRRTLTAGSENSGIAGTLAFMAPEQRFGEPIDARADQYAFAISLQQALAPKHAIGTPSRRVRNALARALSIDPDERFATLDLLLDELSRGAQSRRRLFITLGAGGALTVMAAALAVTRPAADGCAEGASLVDQVWSPGARTSQLAAFLRVRPGAMVTSSSTARLVDDWAERWKLGRKAACTVDGPQRAARLGCLDRGLDELRAQIALWHSADATVVEHAVHAASALPAPQSCATEPGGEVPATLRDEGARLAALVRSGRARQAHQGISKLLELAEAANNPRALALALMQAARIEREAGNLVRSREHYSRAAQEAGHAGDDKVLLHALVEEATVIVDLGRPRDSLGLLDAAAALKARSRIEDEHKVALARADALGQAGKTKEAIDITMKVLPDLELRAIRDPSLRPQLATALGQLAAAQLNIDREAAIRTLQKALALDEGTYGPDHPEVGKTLHDLGGAELQVERYDLAEQHLQRAMKIFLSSYGERHPMVGATFMTTAHLALLRGQVDEARRIYLQAEQALAGVLPADAPHFIVIETGLGDIYRSQDNCAAAIPHFEKAVDLLERSGHTENQHALQLTNLGFCLSDIGRTKQAKTVLLRSLAEIDQLQMPKRWRAEPLAVIAEIEYAAGHKAKAIELEKEALAMLDGQTGSDVDEMMSYMRDKLAEWTK